MIKVGDRVTVKDGSYSLGIKRGMNRLTSLFPAFKPVEFTVIALSCDLPGGRCCLSATYERNDCILLNEASGDVVFSRSAWLHPAIPVCPQPPLVEVSVSEAMVIIAAEKRVPVSAVRLVK